MMQMLAAGGLPVVTDGERTPDEDNPRGYYEWERIKGLPKEPKLIAEAEGKVVKVISQLLFALPPTHSYQIIFMQRALPEVIASQAGMIKRRGTAAPVVGEAVMMTALRAHLAQVDIWLNQHPTIPIHRVEHRQLMADPHGTAESIQKFLNVALDLEAMAQQVDNRLYRNRSV
jgi:hypothetical protein